MDIAQLVTEIHSLRNSASPSRVLLRPGHQPPNPALPVGVLLLKPSSGYLPPETIREVLERLVARHQYGLHSVTWWSGTDLRMAGMMSRHYPGFHRVAHGGWSALSQTAQARAREIFGTDAFAREFGRPFSQELVVTPYDLVPRGITSQRINEVWELDRSRELTTVKCIQRLDDDSFCLAMKSIDAGGEIAGPMVLVNGFFAKLEEDFESDGCVAIWIQQGPGSPTTWEALRSDYAGKTNPFQAPPHTIRGRCCPRRAQGGVGFHPRERDSPQC
jgi:hypothetical protein